MDILSIILYGICGWASSSGYMERVEYLHIVINILYFNL